MNFDHTELQLLLARPNQSLLRLVLSAAPCGASVGMDGRVVYANAECARMWGYDRPEDMNGLSFFELIEPSWHELVRIVWSAGANRRNPWTYELEGVRADGSVFPYRITSFALDLEMGKASFAFFEPIEAATSPAEQIERVLRLAGELER